MSRETFMECFLQMTGLEENATIGELFDKIAIKEEEAIAEILSMEINRADLDAAIGLLEEIGSMCTNGTQTVSRQQIKLRAIQDTLNDFQRMEDGLQQMRDQYELEALEDFLADLFTQPMNDIHGRLQQYNMPAETFYTENMLRNPDQDA
ncbi:unnamed protein product, partial [Rotaria socialis]